MYLFILLLSTRHICFCLAYLPISFMFFIQVFSIRLFSHFILTKFPVVSVLFLSFSVLSFAVHAFRTVSFYFYFYFFIFIVFRCSRYFHSLLLPLFFCVYCNPEITGRNT